MAGEETEILLEHTNIPAQVEKDKRHGVQRFELAIGEELRIRSGDTDWLMYSPSKTATVIINIDIIE